MITKPCTLTGVPLCSIPAGDGNVIWLEDTTDIQNMKGHSCEGLILNGLLLRNNKFGKEASIYNKYNIFFN